MKPNVLPSMREWYERNTEPPAPKPAEDLVALKAIAGVNYPVGVPAKRFARDMQGESELTESQRTYLWQIVWRYRRQIQDKALVKHAGQRCGKAVGK